jgi:hypothetical protein
MQRNEKSIGKRVRALMASGNAYNMPKKFSKRIESCQRDLFTFL